MPSALTPDQLIKAGPSANQEPVSRAAATSFQPLPTAGNPAAPSTDEPAPGVKPKPQVAEGDLSVADILKGFEQSKGNVEIDAEDGVKSKPTPKAEGEEEEPAAEEEEEEEAEEAAPPTAEAEPEVEAEEGEAVVEEETPPTAKVKTEEAKLPEKIAKQMSKPAKEWATAQLKRNTALAAELEELKASGATARGQGWYEHPQAFVLTEEFTQSQKNISEASSVLNHWQEQLVAIKNGDDWQDLGYNQQTGQIFRKTDKLKGDARSDVYVTTRIQQAQQLIQQEQQQLQVMQQEHAVAHQAIPKMLTNLEAKYFPQYQEGIKSKNPKVTEFVTAASNHLKLLKQHHNPLQGFVLKLYAAYLEKVIGAPAATGGKAVVPKGKVKAAAAVGGQQAQAGPTQDNINAGGAVGRKPTNPDDVPFNPADWTTH